MKKKRKQPLVYAIVIIWITLPCRSLATETNQQLDTMATPGFDEPRIASGPFASYHLDSAFDEMFDAERQPRKHYRALYELLLGLPAEQMRRKKQAADV